MGNVDFGMVVQVFLDVVKASAVASVGILLVFALSPVLGKRHTVFWRYALFLCLALRLALPFDISLSEWAAVVPVSAGLERGEGAQEGMAAVEAEEGHSLRETGANSQEAAGQWEKRVETQEGNSLGEEKAGIPGTGSQEDMAAGEPEEHGLREMEADGQGTAGQGERGKMASGMPEEGGFSAKGGIWLWWAALCWAVGVAVYWAWQIGCYGAFLHKIKKTKCFWGRKGHIPVYTTKAVPTPMLTGILKPQILLPAGEYTQEQLGYILGHEFAHYKRKDLWARLLLAAARAFHWFNPLVAVMERQAVKDMELLCDSQAVEGFTKEEKKQYGKTLLAFADSRGSRRPILCTSGLSREGEELKERFANLFSGQRKKGILVATFGMAGLLAVSLFVAFGSSAPAAGERQAASRHKERQAASQPEERQEQPAAGTQGKAEPAVLSLSAQMKNEEPIVPPGLKPEIVADQAEITMENAAEEMINLLSTQEENLNYIRKGSGASEIYKNQNGDRYGFDWAGNLTSFKSSMDLFVYGAAKSTVEECRKAADYYLSFLVEDPSYYTFISGYYRSEKHCYIFYYGHDVQGMVTNDRIEIWVHDLHQSLAYFENPRPGVFKEMDDAVVDEEKILQKALELFNQRHRHEGELINPTLENITVRHKPKRKDKGEIGYEVYFRVDNEDICGCETVQFVPFNSVIQ